MRIFPEKEEYQSYNIYSLKKYVDKKRIMFNIIVSILIIITLLLVIYYLVDTTLRIKKSKEFIAQIVEYQEDHIMGAKSYPVTTILNDIEKDYDKRLTIKDVAAECGYSESHFMRWFKENTGRGFNDYLMGDVALLAMVSLRLMPKRAPIWL